MKEKLLGLLKDEAGQAMSEYGLIIALVAVAVIGAIYLLGQTLSTKFGEVNDTLAK